MTESGVVASIPASVVAQVLRSPRDARVAQLIGGCRCVALDPELARRVGELCGLSGTRDIVDASVIVVAASRGDDVLTTDAADLQRLAAHVRGLGSIRAFQSLRA